MQGYHIGFVLGEDTGGNTKDGGRATMKTAQRFPQNDGPVVGVLGSMIANACAGINAAADQLNLAHFPASCGDALLDSEYSYPNMLRIYGTHTDAGYVAYQLMKSTFNYTRVAIVSERDDAHEQGADDLAAMIQADIDSGAHPWESGPDAQKFRSLKLSRSPWGPDPTKSFISKEDHEEAIALLQGADYRIVLLAMDVSGIMDFLCLSYTKGYYGAHTFIVLGWSGGETLLAVDYLISTPRLSCSINMMNQMMPGSFLVQIIILCEQLIYKNSYKVYKKNISILTL